MSGAKGIVIDAGIECRQRGHWLVSVTVGGGPNLAPLACLGAARSREKAELAMTKAVMLAEEAMRAASPEAFFAARLAELFPGLQDGVGPDQRRSAVAQVPRELLHEIGRDRGLRRPAPQRLPQDRQEPVSARAQEQHQAQGALARRQRAGGQRGQQPRGEDHREKGHVHGGLLVDEWVSAAISPAAICAALSGRPRGVTRGASPRKERTWRRMVQYRNGPVGVKSLRYT
jgi:hypothetical protein